MSARKNSLYKQSFPMAVFGIAVISWLFTGSAIAQDFKRPDGSVPLPMDWSDQHLIYTVGSTPEQMEKMQSDPRFFVAMRLHGKAFADESETNGYPTLSRRPTRKSSPDPTEESSGAAAWRFRPEPPSPGPPWRPPFGPRRRVPAPLTELKTDWSVSLGAGGVAAGQSPAKFSFDVTAAPSCTADYVVFPINATTGSTRANVVGTFSTTTGYSSGTAVTYTVSPAGASSIMLTLTPSITLNTGLNFQVFSTGNSANATTSAANLAAAINRNLSATALGRVVAAASTNTVTVYPLTAGTRITLSVSENLNNFSFGTVTAGGNGTQANIVGFNNLYSGSGTPFCTGKTFPTFTFSYASGYAGVSTSPVISLDGTKIAYIENGPSAGLILHVLTIGTGTEHGTCTNSGTTLPTCATGTTGPVIPGSTSGSTATDFMLPLSLPAFNTVVSDTRSAPFVNYDTDTLYVGDDAGHLYAVTGVFMGTPAPAGGNFPVTVSSGNFLNSPVVDAAGTGNIFIGDSLSNTYEYSSAGTPEGPSISIGNGMQGGIWDGALVDSTNSKVYFATNCSGTGGNSQLTQIAFTASGLGTVWFTSIDTNGEGCTSTSLPQYGAMPDNLYYTAGIGSYSIGSNGHVIVSYQGTASVHLAQWGFTNTNLITTREWDNNSFLSSGGYGSSPSTEFEGGGAYTPTALTQNGTTVTVTTATNGFVTGEAVTIAGVAAGSGGCTSAAVAAINGVQTVTVLSQTQFTFTSSVTTTITGGACSLTSSSATGAVDYLFFGTTQPSVWAFSLPLSSNSQTALASNTASVTDGTSGIIVDNDSSDGQASSIYFGTQATSTTQCGTTAAYCAVKLTQSGLQ